MGWNRLSHGKQRLDWLGSATGLSLDAHQQNDGSKRQEGDGKFVSPVRDTRLFFLQRKRIDEKAILLESNF